MACRGSAVLYLLVFLIIAGNQIASSQEFDPHDLYERYCARCHSPHARAFVDERLERIGNKIVMRGTDVGIQSVLAGGHGRLTPAQIDVMMAHLNAILESGGVFRDKCLICHGRAVTFARYQLTSRDGLVVGRYTGRNIEVFLQTHGRLDSDQASIIIQMLKRQLVTEIVK